MYPEDGVGKGELAEVGELLLVNLEGGDVGYQRALAIALIQWLKSKNKNDIGYLRRKATEDIHTVLRSRWS